MAIKIERTSDGGNWIAAIGRRYTVVKPDQIGDLTLVDRRGKAVVAVERKDETERQDLQSAVNTIMSPKYEGITGVVVDNGEITITMPVDKAAVLKAKMDDIDSE